MLNKKVMLALVLSGLIWGCLAVAEPAQAVIAPGARNCRWIKNLERSDSNVNNCFIADELGLATDDEEQADEGWCESFEKPLPALPYYNVCCCMKPIAASVITPPSPPIKLQPQIPIPGLNFGEPQCTANPDGTTDCKYNWIAQYINAIYNYGLSVAGILAAIMLMAGGALWLISGGDSSKVTQAKELIIGSISGLVILSCAWVILNTINPALVQLSLIGGQEIITDREPISSDGNPDNSRGCDNCVELSSGIAYKNGHLVESSLNAKLTVAQNNSSGLAWRVTEAWPVSRRNGQEQKHQATCHYNGRCVDLALTGSSSCTDVRRLIAIMEAAGLKVLNEYLDCGGTRTANTTGGHLHIR